MSFIPRRRLPRPGWAFLPLELQSQIILHLPRERDLAAFSIICTTWNAEAERCLYSSIWLSNVSCERNSTLLVRTIRESHRLRRLVREVDAYAYVELDQPCNLYRLLRLILSLEVLRLKINGDSDAGFPSVPWSELRFRSTLRILELDDFSKPTRTYQENLSEFLASCPNLEVLKARNTILGLEIGRPPPRLKRLELVNSKIAVMVLESYLSMLPDGSALRLEYSRSLPVPTSALTGLLIRMGGRLGRLDLKMDLLRFSEKDLGMLIKSCHDLEVLKVSAYDFGYMMRHMWPPQLKCIALLRVPVDIQPTSFPYSWRWLEELPKTMKDLTVYYDHWRWNDPGDKLPIQGVKMFKRAKVDLGMKVSLRGRFGDKILVASEFFPFCVHAPVRKQMSDQHGIGNRHVTVVLN